MSHIVTAVFAIALILLTVTLLATASFSSASRISLAWDGMVQRNSERDRTALALISADIMPTSTNVDISIRNSGQTALRDFANWDVTIQYYATTSNQGLSISWLLYTASSTPPSGQWTVRGVYLDAATLKAEVYEPNILNQGEESIVRVNITPAIPTSTDNLVTIGTPNGVTVSAPFSR